MHRAAKSTCWSRYPVAAAVVVVEVAVVEMTDGPVAGTDSLVYRVGCCDYFVAATSRS